MEKQKLKSTLLLITYALLLYFAVYKWRDLKGTIVAVIDLIMPFIMGACLAFILSIPMNVIEKKLPAFMNREKCSRFKRPVSLSTTLLAAAGIIWFVFFLVIPEVNNTIGRIAESIPGYLKRMESLAEDNSHLLQEIIDTVPALNPEALLANFTENWKTYVGSIFSSTFNVIGSVAKSIFNMAVALIVAIYILFAKETLGRQVKKVIYAFFANGKAKRIEEIGKLTHKTFSNFLTGQCMEALILGGMFFVTLLIFKLPYALLIAVVISVTALIPIFGAFIGCILGAFLILMIDPVKALVFVILFLVLQQVEGNLIYPKVVGSSVGLPSLWVLAAVTIGGNTMGIAGMLLFIPLVSVFYALLRESVDKRLKVKKIRI